MKYFQSSYDRPDPAEVRKRYELELKEQMEAKKKIEDEVSLVMGSVRAMMIISYCYHRERERRGRRRRGLRGGCRSSRRRWRGSLRRSRTRRRRRRMR